MIKSLAMIPRKAGTTRQDFQNYYETQHAPLALSMIGSFRGYLRNHVLRTLSEEEPEYDVLSSFWFEGEAEVREIDELLASPRGEILRNDERQFMNQGGIVSFGVRERPAPESDPPPPGRARQGTKVVAEWSGGVQSPEIEALAEALQAERAAGRLAHWVLNEPLSTVEVPGGGRNLSIAAVAELWYRDAPAMESALAKLFGLGARRPTLVGEFETDLAKAYGA